MPGSGTRDTRHPACLHAGAGSSTQDASSADYAARRRSLGWGHLAASWCCDRQPGHRGSLGAGECNAQSLGVSRETLHSLLEDTTNLFALTAGHAAVPPVQTPATSTVRFLAPRTGTIPAQLDRNDHVTHRSQRLGPTSPCSGTRHTSAASRSRCATSLVGRARRGRDAAPSFLTCPSRLQRAFGGPTSWPTPACRAAPEAEFIGTHAPRMKTGGHVPTAVTTTQPARRAPGPRHHGAAEAPSGTPAQVRGTSMQGTGLQPPCCPGGSSSRDARWCIGVHVRLATAQASSRWAGRRRSGRGTEPPRGHDRRGQASRFGRAS